MRRLPRIAKGEISVLSSRIVSLLIGPITVLAVGFYLTPVIQGYYYTFGSILAASAFFEAGVSTAIVQFAAHESGRLRFHSKRAISGPSEARMRLSGVLRFAVTWFWGAALLMGAFVAILGFVIFTRQEDGVDWAMPWLCLVLVSVASFCLQPLFAFLEGIGRVEYTYRYRTVRSLSQSAVLIICIASGAELYSLAIAGLASFLVGILFILPTIRLLRVSAWRRGRGALDWRREVLPFQWRIAVSWAAGYFTVAAFTPIMMATRGPVDAGKVGMTVTLLVACTSLSASFLQAHAPKLGALHGSADHQNMAILFRRKFWTSLSACILLFVILLAAAGMATSLDLPLVDRVVPIGTLAIFCLGFLLYHMEGLLAFFMRAQKTEPYFLMEALGALLILPSTLFLGSHFGPFGVAIGFTLVHFIVLTPIAITIFLRSHRRVIGTS
jgi:O-antigen/teichoic acid export membrane protein